MTLTKFEIARKKKLESYFLRKFKTIGNFNLDAVLKISSQGQF